MYPSYLESYFCQLNEYLQWQTERIRLLEARVNALTVEVEELKAQRAIKIDKIEYKFDQLKVEKLDGTLNIGLSPAGLGDQSLDDLSVGGASVIKTNTARSESFARIQAAVYSYLDQQCPMELQQFEYQYQLQLGDSFGRLMIEDLRRQTGDRIQHYLTHTIDPNQLELTPEQEQDIIMRVQRDIRTGMETYVKNKKRDGDELNDLTGGQ
ncbi:spore germination protein GerPC [Paenibacillus cremeus]|uniref:Spore gernimation protein GerPC n=1 Tax=Paenibacillus cremeus TaxID=2163881 RepID=A0A559KBN1_9BACL|nr:spore germination protein GerPC [Paenibacillus cremeus]TVY09537.1 spore gernimation protein GerPC [Paenibacillus cremeus]